MPASVALKAPQRAFRCQGKHPSRGQYPGGTLAVREGAGGVASEDRHTRRLHAHKRSVRSTGGGPGREPCNLHTRRGAAPNNFEARLLDVGIALARFRRRSVSFPSPSAITAAFPRSYRELLSRPGVCFAAVPAYASRKEFLKVFRGDVAWVGGRNGGQDQPGGFGDAIFGQAVVLQGPGGVECFPQGVQPSSARAAPKAAAIRASASGAKGALKASTCGRMMAWVWAWGRL